MNGTSDANHPPRRWGPATDAPALSRRRLLVAGATAAAGVLASPRLRAAPTTPAPLPAPAPAATTGDVPEQPPHPLSQLHGDILGELRTTVTWKTDNLLDLARAEDLGMIEILAANPGVDPWLPGSGTEILLPTAHILPSGPREDIVICLAQLRVYYYDRKRGPMTFPIGVGREGFATPLGSTKIVRKQPNPTWYPTASRLAEDPPVPRVVPPGPDNPLGEFAMYLGWPAYLMHGTNKPDGVGRRVSHGCIRFYPEDIAFLFRNVPVGTPVRTNTDLVKLGRRDGQLYIEVHPSLDQIDQLEADNVAQPEPLPDQTDRILMAAGDDSKRLDWTAIDRATKERKGIPVQITR
jgi:L,D-transpeptidase ErfK/SrfK